MILFQPDKLFTSPCLAMSSPTISWIQDIQQTPIIKSKHYNSLKLIPFFPQQVQEPT